MATISGDDSHAGLRKFDINCQDALPVCIAFTDNDKMIVSGERNSNVPGGRLVQYHVAPDSDKRNAPQNLDAVGLTGIDRVAVSKDGKWIVIIARTSVMVRNMITGEVAEVYEHPSSALVQAVDISPDSTTFATGSEDGVIRVFNINTRRLLTQISQPSSRPVIGVKFSPNGAYLATAATGYSLCVWDVHNYHGNPSFQASNNAIYYPPQITWIPLVWSSQSDRVFTISSGRVMVLQSSYTTSSSGSYYSRQSGYLSNVQRFERVIPASNDPALYSLATNGRIIACAVGGSLSFWDSFTSCKIGPTITLQESVLSLALSSDDSFLACGRGNKKVTVYFLRDILPLHTIIDPTSHIPFMNVSYAAFQLWMKQEWYTASNTLEQETRSLDRSYANLSLTQAHRQDWNSAIRNARQSLEKEPSIICHIALARALVGQGQQELAFEAIDAVFRTCGGDEIRFLLLIKAILMFLSGKRESAITRVKDLVPDSSDSEKYNALQVLGNMYFLQGDCPHAFESFERARSLSFYRRGHYLMTILLIFGPFFEEREFALRHPMREAVTV